MKYRWVPRVVDDVDAVQELQTRLNNLPEALARALVLRGVDTFENARQFFRPSVDQLHDPFLMRDMDLAADRILQAIGQKEKVLVYGDYDVDGTTSTALMTSFLRKCGVETTFFIPDRLEHGYGLCESGIDHAIDARASLIVALDCGITAIRQAAYAREKGIDLIICDHHHPEAEIPVAVAVLNPKRPDCRYPFKELSGCGVGFKLVQAVMQRLGQDPSAAREYLDLVAVSTASDIVPVSGENRVLMFEGMRVLRENGRAGFIALAERAGLDMSACTSSRMAFGIGPRINAAGRMGDACRAVDLLLETDYVRAVAMAGLLEDANMDRRKKDQEVLLEARKKAEIHQSGSGRHSLVLFGEDWHLGVIGIVASRLVEQYYRPTIILTRHNGDLKGSARSIAGINIYDALKQCEDLLTTFGGHDFAAGLTLPEKNFDAFRSRFDAAIGEIMSADLMVPAISVDAKLDLREIDDRFWAVLRQFEPYGPENDCPIFQGVDLEVYGRLNVVGKEQEHLKFLVRQRGSTDRPMEVMAFRMGKLSDRLRFSQNHGRPIDLLFSIEENKWNGSTRLQLRAHDLQIYD